MDKISIIIPVRNEEDYISDALGQFFIDPIAGEIIVTDDGSTDRTREIAESYGVIFLDHTVEHHLAKRFPHLERSTIGANRNFGARNATGEFLLFIDAETRIENCKDFITRSLKHFHNDPELVALTGALWVIPELETWGDRLVYTVFNWVHRLKNNWLGAGEASGKFQMIRRTAFDKVGGYREDLVTREDGDMFARLSRIGTTLCDPKLCVLYSGRRAHTVGWPRLLATWMLESLSFAFRGRAISTNWDRIDTKAKK